MRKQKLELRLLSWLDERADVRDLLGRESSLLHGASGGSGLLLPLAEVASKVMIAGCPLSMI
jgi:hypothetical protein